MQNFDEIQDFLIRTKTPHTIKVANNSTTIKAGKKTYFITDGEKIDTKHLNFIKHVKQEVCDNAERLSIKHVKPKYFEFNGIGSRTRIIRNAVEVDINGAYWQTALNEGLITHSTFEKGLTVPKKIRLMAFGSAATLKDVFVFDGNEYTESFNEFNQHGRNAFFHVSNIVGVLMRSILERVPGIFSLFWVDAIFIHSMYSSYVTDEIEAAGYEYKTNNVPLIHISPGSDQKPDVVRMIVERGKGEFPFFEKKTFQKNRKNKTKNVEKIIKNPLFALKSS